jgi:hypothetical protein
MTLLESQRGSMWADDNRRESPTERPLRALYAGVAVATLAAAGVMILTLPKPVAATPAYATQTGYSCERCHTSAGSAKLTSFGENWAKQKK